jgi:hypothetical protein
VRTTAARHRQYIRFTARCRPGCGPSAQTGYTGYRSRYGRRPPAAGAGPRERRRSGRAARAHRRRDHLQVHQHQQDGDPTGTAGVWVAENRGGRGQVICAGCQVRDQCRELAVKAAGGLDHDHSVFGETLPAERSRLRENRFPEPSVYRQDREAAEQAHQLATQVGLRQAAHQLGVHRDALKAAFAQWGLPALERRLGWQPSRLLADRAEAERAFALAERLGSVNAAATELGTTWPSLRKAFTRPGLGMPARNPRRSGSA